MAFSPSHTTRPPDDVDILSIIASNPPSHAVTLAAIAGAAAVVASGAVALPRLLPKPGPARLVAIVPLLAILAALPLAPPPSVVLRGTVAFVCWLAAMKLLAFACGRGALALPGLSDVRRALLLLLPITPLRPQHQHQHHQKQATEPTTAWRSSALAALNAAALAAFIVVLREDGRGGGEPWPPMPPLVRHAMYAAVVYLAVALVLDSFAPLALASAFGGASSSSGPALAPSMRAPWGARSLSSFWSYHYNTAVSDALRHCAYAPVAQGSLFKRGGGGSGGGGDGNNNKQQQRQHDHPHVSPARRAAGLTLVFFVSGLAHEVIVNGFMCGAAQEQRRLAATAARRGGGATASLGPRPGLMMGFFLAQVPALLLEQRVHDLWRDRRRRRFRQEQQNGRPHADGNGAAAAPAAAKTSSWAGAAFALASHALRAALTLLALLLMTDWGFFPAMEACAVDKAGIEEVGAAVDRLRAAAAARGWSW